MTYSPQWDEIYAAGKQLTRWPFPDLVSAAKRHIPDLKGKGVLELGCGACANARFFLEEGCGYWGIDGSETSISNARQNCLGGWPQECSLHVGDFTNYSFGKSEFDLICDRAAVTHNDTVSIEACLRMIYQAMKPGGLYIGIDWFSTHHPAWQRCLGRRLDENTLTDIKEGQFAGVGPVHFSTKAHLLDLFSRFEMIEMEHKVVTCELGDRQAVGTWNFVARKP